MRAWGENFQNIYSCLTSFLRGYTLIASLLVKHHANPLKSNKSGENAFHIAAANGNHSICNILHKITSIDPFLRDVEGVNLLFIAFSDL